MRCIAIQILFSLTFLCPLSSLFPLLLSAHYPSSQPRHNDWYDCENSRISLLISLTSRHALDVVLRCTVMQSVVPHYAVFHCTVLYCTVLCPTIRCCSALHYVVLCSDALWCTMWWYNVFLCTVLNCTMLSCTAVHSTVHGCCAVTLSLSVCAVPYACHLLGYAVRALIRTGLKYQNAHSIAEQNRAEQNRTQQSKTNHSRAEHREAVQTTAELSSVE
jgi:hypothetical protein